MSSNTPSNYSSIQLLPEDQRFDGENYVSWRDTMIPTGRTKGLDLYWEGKVTIPFPNTPSPYGTSTTAVNDPYPSHLEYRLRESVAYLTIWNNIKNPSGLGIPSGKTSTELWKYLEAEYILVSHLARQCKEDELHMCRYVDGVDGKITGEGGYAERFHLLRKGALDAGSQILDKQFITIFLDSFPCDPDWNVVTGSLMIEKSFNVAAGCLQDFHLRRSGSNAHVPSIQKTSALEAAMERISKLEQALNASNDKQGSGKHTDLICTNQNCPPKNRVGHTTDTCFAIGGGKQGQYPAWWKGKKTAPLPTANTMTTPNQIP